MLEFTEYFSLTAKSGRRRKTEFEQKDEQKLGKQEQRAHTRQQGRRLRRLALLL